MSGLLAAAAEALGAPEHLVERSAAARAAAEGVTVDDLLAAWAGGAPAPSSGAAPPPAAAQPPPPAADPVPAAVTPAPAAPPAPDLLAAAAAAMTLQPAAAAASPPAPARVSRSEALDFEAVVTSPTTGITERIAAAAPRWLTVLLFAVPLVGLTYLVTFAGGPNCGSGGQLSVDRLTGEVENCDGSEFAVGGGAGGVDIRALIAEGTALYADPSNCASCHGGGGEGGSGPALAGGVLGVFSMCVDHIEWVSLGTTGFLDAGRSVYGDTGQAVGAGGQMPSFQDTLTESQIAAVVFYERVVMGGQDPEEAVFDCGFAEPEGEGEEAPAEETDGEAPA